MGLGPVPRRHFPAFKLGLSTSAPASPRPRHCSTPVMLLCRMQHPTSHGRSTELGARCKTPCLRSSRKIRAPRHGFDPLPLPSTAKSQATEPCLSFPTCNMAGGGNSAAPQESSGDGFCLRPRVGTTEPLLHPKIGRSLGSSPRQHSGDSSREVWAPLRREGAGSCRRGGSRTGPGAGSRREDVCWRGHVAPATYLHTRASQAR